MDSAGIPDTDEVLRSGGQDLWGNGPPCARSGAVSGYMVAGRQQDRLRPQLGHLGGHRRWQERPATDPDVRTGWMAHVVARWYDGRLLHPTPREHAGWRAGNYLFA